MVPEWRTYTDVGKPGGNTFHKRKDKNREWSCYKWKHWKYTKSCTIFIISAIYTVSIYIRILAYVWLSECRKYIYCSHCHTKYVWDYRYYITLGKVSSRCLTLKTTLLTLNRICTSFLLISFLSIYNYSVFKRAEHLHKQLFKYTLRVAHLTLEHIYHDYCRAIINMILFVDFLFT